MQFFVTFEKIWIVTLLNKHNLSWLSTKVFYCIIIPKIIAVKKKSREDHRFTQNFGLMMMIVENIPWNISVWKVIFNDK